MTLPLSGADVPRSIVYTRHARIRMRERRVQDIDVAIVIAEPDALRYGDDGETIATKVMGRRTIEVVYVDEADARRVITVVIE